jgi:hypothetical protein
MVCIVHMIHITSGHYCGCHVEYCFSTLDLKDNVSVLNIIEFYK